MLPRFVRRFDHGVLIAEALATAALLKTATVGRLVEDELDTDIDEPSVDRAAAAGGRGQ
jgi:hypothetical protein